MQTDSESALEHILLKALMENIRGYIYFKDREGRFIRIGGQYARFLGLRDAAEAIGKTAGDFFSEDHARKAFEDERHIIRTGQPLLDVEEKESRGSTHHVGFDEQDASARSGRKHHRNLRHCT